VQRWRDELRDAGVWANDPVPLFPYPGSPDYRRLCPVERRQRLHYRRSDHFADRSLISQRSCRNFAICRNASMMSVSTDGVG
jgi:hypothetical protein